MDDCPICGKDHYHTDCNGVPKPVPIEQQLAAARLAGKIEGLKEAAKTAASWSLTIWPGPGITAYTVKETEGFANGIGPSIATAIRAKIAELKKET